MINVFVIHSGKDYDYVKTYVEPYLEGRIDAQGNPIPNPQPSRVRILTLESKGRIWKPEAGRKLRQAQVVLFLMGSDAEMPAKRQTIGWEVRRALQYQKIIFLHKRDREQSVPEYFLKKDRFTGQEHPVAEHMELEAIYSRIERLDAGEYEIFSPWFRTLKTEERDAYMDKVMEQYKLYQHTSEELVSRRQNVNSFYQALNGLLLTVLAAMLGAVGNDQGLIRYINPAAALIMLSMVGFALDWSWIRLLDSYGKLNSAKMKVLNLLEQNLPIEIYRVEWDVMSDRLHNKPYKPFTATEKRIPSLFCVIYALAALVGLLIL